MRALLMWFAECFAAGGILICLMLLSCRAPTSTISENDLKNAEKVVAHSRSAIAEEDRVAADRFFDIGMRAEEQGNNWGAAAKAFGESAVANPRSRTFVRLANAELRMLSVKPGVEKSAILASARNYYEVALALDAANSQLTDDEREVLLREVACISAFIGEKVRDGTCHALQVVLNRAR